MPKYREFGGDTGDDTPCICRECDCETFDECNWPFNSECRCNGACCDTTNMNNNPLLVEEKELIDARNPRSRRTPFAR